MPKIIADARFLAGIGLRATTTQRTKYCPAPPSLPDYNANIESFSTNRKLTTAFHQHEFIAQTIAQEYKRFTATLCRRH
ncbi:hypothetical protein [Burkholderia sola]